MVFIIEALVVVLVITGGISLLFVLGDAGVWLRRRLNGKADDVQDDLPAEIAAIENHKSGEDGSPDFD